MQPPAQKLAVLPTTLVLVGASVRAAAESARRGDFDVIGVDLFGDSDTLATCATHVLLNPSKPKLALDAVPPLAQIVQVGGLNEPTFLKNAIFLGATPQTYTELKDPVILAEIAKKCGLSVPETISRSDLRTRGGTLDNGRWLRKSLRSSGGMGVTWHPGEANRDQPDSAQPDSDWTTDWIVQRWIPGRGFGASFVADCNQTLLLGLFRSLFVRQGSRPFTYAGSYGPVSPQSTATKRVCEIGSRIAHLGELVAERFGLRGLFNVDLVIDAAGQGWVLEINPRWTAASELVERHFTELGILADDDSLMRWHVLANHSLKVPSLDRVHEMATSSNWIKRIVYADRGGKIDVNSLDGIRNRPRIEFADLPPATRVHKRGDPVLSMIARLVDRPTQECGLAILHSEASERDALSPPQWRRAIRETLELIEPA